MSATWGIAGSSPLADLTKPIDQLMQELLFAQWSITNPAKGTTAEQPGAPEKIKFGTNWGSGVKLQYEIHCMTVSDPSEPISTGWNYHQYHTVVDVHVFAKKTANSLGFSDSTQLFNMMKEVKRIIAQKKNDLGQGVKPIRFIEWVRADDPEEFGKEAYWHRIARVEVNYFMVDAS